MTRKLGDKLHALTLEPFTPKANRSKTFDFGSISTTEVCNLSCVMCHFNGPQAIKKGKTLSPEFVEKALRDLPAGSQVWFAATGEFFVDPHALDHLRAASRLGLQPCVLSHGQFYTPELLDQVLDAGVRFFRMSADSNDPVQYAKARRGGQLQKILDACAYLRAQKPRYPGLRVEINCTLLHNTFEKQSEMADFWQDRVDAVNFNAEYHDIFRYRNVFYLPEERVDCTLQTYVLPSGYIAPCCAVMVYQHENDASWLPHISQVSLPEAYDQLCDMYEDPASPLAALCRGCDWWIMWTQRNGMSPYLRTERFDTPPEGVASGEGPSWRRWPRSLVMRAARKAWSQLRGAVHR